MPKRSVNYVIVKFLAILLALSAPAGAAVDDSYTNSLLHFTGADGSTTFIDESGKTWNAPSQAQIKTDNYKFGSASAYFDGGFIETPNSADFEPGAEPFTIDFWIFPLSAGNNTYLAGKSNPNAEQGYDIRLHDYKIQVRGVNGWSVNLANGLPSVNTGSWNHIAVSSTASTVYLFINGLSKGSCDRGTIASRDIPFRLGYTTDFEGTAFNGYMDEFRFSKGVARWTTNDFTPPPQPYGSNGAVNLAYLHGVASASSSYLEYVPSRTKDGEWGTNWFTLTSGTVSKPMWLKMDLQKKYKIDQIKLIGQQTTSNFTVVYNLYTSADGVNWKMVHSGTLVSSLDPEKYMRTIPLTTGNVCQYVKYDVVGGTNLPLLYEMEIWGGPNPVTPPIAAFSLLLLD